MVAVELALACGLADGDPVGGPIAGSGEPGGFEEGLKEHRLNAEGHQGKLRQA